MQEGFIITQKSQKSQKVFLCRRVLLSHRNHRKFYGASKDSVEITEIIMFEYAIASRNFVILQAKWNKQ